MIVLQTYLRLFFANKFGAGFMVQTCFGVDILLHSYLWHELSTFLLQYLVCFYFDQQNVIKNSIRNPCVVLAICLKIITHITTAFVLTFKTSSV